MLQRFLVPTLKGSRVEALRLVDEAKLRLSQGDPTGAHSKLILEQFTEMMAAEMQYLDLKTQCADAELANGIGGGSACRSKRRGRKK